MSSRDRRAERLAAWKDGELRGLAARRAARLLDRSPEARREVETVEAVGQWVREAWAAGAEAEPDPASELWSGLRPRLAALDAARAEANETPHGGLLRPLTASAALAAAVAALVLGLSIQTTPPGDDVVQWLDSEGAPVMVWDGSDDTIIWVLQPGNEEISGRGSRTSA